MIIYYKSELKVLYVLNSMRLEHFQDYNFKGGDKNGFRKFNFSAQSCTRKAEKIKKNEG